MIMLISELATLTNPTQAVATFKSDYSKLYDKLCTQTEEPATVLLLYFLLHQNSAFRNYVLSRVNIDSLVIFNSIFSDFYKSILLV